MSHPPHQADLHEPVSVDNGRAAGPVNGLAAALDRVEVAVPWRSLLSLADGSLRHDTAADNSPADEFPGDGSSVNGSPANDPSQSGDVDAADAAMRSSLGFHIRNCVYGNIRLSNYVARLKLQPFFTYSLATNDPEEVASLPDHLTHNILNLQKINDIRYINKFFEAVNAKLPYGGIFVGCVEPLNLHRERMQPPWLSWIPWLSILMVFLLWRVAPKLILTKRLYFTVTQGRNRAVSRAEILGRLVACGFAIMDSRTVGNKIYVTVRKQGPPLQVEDASYGPIFKVKRVGKDGRLIKVYKFRTMHPYAEFLQPLVHQRGGLAENGKFADDFRVAAWGRFMRSIWLDEVPMLINLLRGQLKLVGVRPLSEHYLSLYPKDLAEFRRSFRPGLLPPFYADLPRTFDEVIASERRYLEAYRLRPIHTDTRYFFRIVYNIVIKGARSS